MIRSSVRSAGLAILLTMNGCGSLTSSDPGTKAPGLGVAEAALEGGAGQIALQVSEGVLHDNPHDMRALAIKGDALTLLGEYADATAVFQAILAKDPNSVRANTGLGRLKLSKDPAAAEALFQAVLKREPKDLTALNNVGIARDLQGHHAEAQTAYRQALAISPALDSAQINLALSLAMTGHGPEAIQLLKAKATEPGAPAKVRRDYAVVLAMSGNRPEAERVLSNDLPPDQIRQVLDGATGTRTAARDTAPPRMAASVPPPQDDVVPPDVVQVPEGQAPHAAPAGQIAAAPAPMVIRPRTADSDSEAPMVQPTNSIAAAMTNQRPLALPIRSTSMLTPAGGPPAEVVTEVVADPARPAAIRVASVDSPRLALPDAPPPPAVLAPVPFPPAYRPLPFAARAVAPAPKVATVSTETTPAEVAPIHSGLIAAAAAATPIRTAIIAPEPPRMAAETTSVETTPAEMTPVGTTPAETTSIVATAAAVGPIALGDGIAPAVQFAATASEESAHAFWQSLVHRFPDVLSQREPTVIRFEHAGSVFWRVRTEGFGTLSEAQNLCARMRVDGQACFVPKS